MREFGRFKESYFKEKRVIDVAINFPIAEKNKTKEIAGKLEITDDGIFLEIFSENREGDEPLEYKEEIDCLTGNGDSKRFYLFNLKFIKLGSRRIGQGLSIREQRFQCEDILVFNQRLSDLSLIEIHIDGLKEFLGPTKQICNFLNGFKQESENKIEVVDLKDSVFLYHFDFNESWTPMDYISSSRVAPSVIFSFKNPIRFSEKKVKELVKKYQILHSFLTGKNYGIEKVLINGDEAEFYSDGFNCVEDSKKKYSMLHWGHNLSEQFQNLYGTDYEIPGDVIYNWFSLSDDEFDVCELFYGARFVKDKYQRFINLYVCLEFMVQKYRSNYFDDEVFGKILAKVEEIVNTEASSYKKKKKEDFFNSVKRVNEERAPTLELIKKCAKQEGLIDLWNEIGIKEEILRKIVKDRNHIIHGDIGKVSGLELYNDILELSVYFLILQRLGIDREILVFKLGAYIDYNRVRNSIERFGFTSEDSKEIINAAT